MNPKAGIAGALTALVVGVVGGSRFASSSERLAALCLDHLTAIVQQKSKAAQEVRTELSPPGERLDATQGKQMSKALRSQLEFIEAQLIPTLDIRKRVKDGGLHVERLVQKAEGQADREFIDLLVLKPVDLSKGRLGDAKRPPNSADALVLPTNLALSKGDRVRIFTTAVFGEVPYGVRVVELNHAQGIWKGDPGEGDRIWIATHHGELVLDFDYEITSPVAALPEHARISPPVEISTGDRSDRDASGAGPPAG